MLQAIALALALLLPLIGPAWAGDGTASGNSGLALAALVAANSPRLSATDKKTVAALFDGNLNVVYPAGKKIRIAAGSIICLAGDVDITRHSCTLAFGKIKVRLSGRKAHEIYATLGEVGVPSDGAAGTIYESLTDLACTVDPNEIKQEGGGGVTCNFETDAP